MCHLQKVSETSHIQYQTVAVFTCSICNQQERKETTALVQNREGRHDDFHHLQAEKVYF